MGWYSALALGGSLQDQDAYELINTMGSMMKNKIIGGQLIYPIVDNEWHIDKKIKNQTLQKIKNADAYVSIFFGGIHRYRWRTKSIDKLKKELPPMMTILFKYLIMALFILLF
ncbi:MAG: hypothetical protein Ct9H90mP7_0770 [Candidatus Neomarinimicrobiota bacterium]|nr:MAG: hypothetical protein Ct9H90mP7_0770 [Candidatus Neomarinimicrobiota bacterium]